MPKDEVAGVDLDQYQKEKEEFNDAVDAVLSADPEKSDDEIMEAFDKADDDSTSEAGDATKDSTDEAAKKKSDDDSELNSSSQGITDGEATVTKEEKVPDGTDLNWQEKAESLEAELAKERQKTSSWNGRITAANKRVKELEDKIVELNALIAAKASTNDTAASDDSDQAKLDRFREDFPEMGDVLSILQQKIDNVKPRDKVDTTESTDDVPYDGPTDTDTEPVVTDHMKKITDVHPDLGEMVNSGILLTWINKQPDYIQPALQTIYKTGSADQVIKMVTEFKEKTGWKSQLDQATDDSGKKKQSKLDSMKEVDSESTGAPTGGPDKNDFAGTAKEIGL